MSSKYTRISKTDASQGAIITEDARNRLLYEIEGLRKCAGFSRDLSVYTALNVSPMCYGGSFSLTKPVLVVPYEMIFRPHASRFGMESPNENLDKNIHLFTDDETRFLLSREISHLKFNDKFFKTAAKILLIAVTLFLFWSNPLGWLATAAIVAGAFSIYIIADWFYESRIDRFAAEIAGQAIGDPERANRAAVSALMKLRDQNLEWRSQSFFARLYITKAGNNLFDFKHPLITNRIEKMQQLIDVSRNERRVLA